MTPSTPLLRRLILRLPRRTKASHRGKKGAVGDELGGGVELKPETRLIG